MAKTKAKAAAAESTVPAASNDVQTMYIGPGVRKLGLISGRVYRSDSSIFFAPLKEKYSLIGTLLVPIDGIGAAKARMKTKGSAEWLAVRQLIGGDE